MNGPFKLKSSTWEAIAFIVVLPVILAGTWIIFGKEAFRTLFWMIMLLAALMHFVFLTRTKNPVYWIPMLFYTFMALAFLTPYRPLQLLFAVGAGILFILLMYVLFTNRIKWRYREILELAARPVNQSDDGFTPRPFPAGDAKYTRAEISGFARFVLKQVIAFPYFAQDRIVFVVPERMYRDFFFLRRNYLKHTYVSFDFDGKVSVNIAKKDYQKYKEELTFDQLCQSLGNLFKEFLGLYQKGESKRIIGRLNALKIAA